MPRTNSVLRQTLFAIVLASLTVCPLALAAGVTTAHSELLLQATIDFDPNVTPFATEAPPDSVLAEELLLPEIFVEGTVLVVDGVPYPVGDGFYDAEGIPLGQRVTDSTGLYGYAVIETMPSHVLIWYLDGNLKERYLVTTADDPLLHGELGFFKMIEKLQAAENRYAASFGSGVAGVVTATILQLAVCPGTAGTTCATGAATLAIGGGLAFIGTAGLMAFDLVPALNNVERAFGTLDTNRP